jgi:hypothetical protein
MAVSKSLGSITLETFYQEFKDSQNYLKEILEEIKTQVKYTNGRVTKLEIDKAVVSKECESLKKDILNIKESDEKSFNHGHSNRTFWLSVISIFIAILTFILKLSDFI